MEFDYKNASKEELKNEYKRIAKESGDDQYFTKKELEHLPEVLQENEQIIAFSSGFMDGNTWLITLTDKRIIFLDKGMFFGFNQTYIPLEKVNAVSGQTGLLLGDIIITDGAKDRKITNVPKKTVQYFTNKTQEAIENIKNKKEPLTSSNSNLDNDIYSQLEKLAKLKEKGIINDNEFQVAKRKLLGTDNEQSNNGKINSPSPVPPPMNKPPVIPTHKYFIYFEDENQRNKQYSFLEIKQLLQNGQITADYYIWRDGITDWILIKDCNDFK